MLACPHNDMGSCDIRYGCLQGCTGIVAGYSYCIEGKRKHILARLFADGSNLNESLFWDDAGDIQSTSIRKNSSAYFSLLLSTPFTTNING